MPTGTPRTLHTVLRTTNDNQYYLRDLRLRHQDKAAGDEPTTVTQGGLKLVHQGRGHQAHLLQVRQTLGQSKPA